MDLIRVVRWRHSNVGNTVNGDLARVLPDGSFVVLTGPSPWGTGTWGPFPASCILDTRAPRSSDQWSVNGCPSAKWNCADLVRAIRDSRRYPEVAAPLADAIEASLTLTIGS